jgi:hypothetical protein
MSEIKRSYASLFLTFAAVATVLPAYSLVRWLWAWRQPHADFQGAVTVFETGFPFGLRGAPITWASVASAGAGVVAAGLVLQRTHGVTRAVAYTILSVAATLVAWNLWTMM